MGSSELRIRDTVLTEAGRRLIGLQILLDALGARLPALQNALLRVGRGAWGYGPMVCSLEDDLLSSTEVTIKFQELRNALARGEYFYDVQLTAEAVRVRFGVVDSAWLFVEGQDELIESIGAEFNDTEVVEVDR